MLLVRNVEVRDKSLEGKGGKQCGCLDLESTTLRLCADHRARVCGGCWHSPQHKSGELDYGAFLRWGVRRRDSDPRTTYSPQAPDAPLPSRSRRPGSERRSRAEDLFEAADDETNGEP